MSSDRREVHTKGALLDGSYRYRLWRRWGNHADPLSGTACFVMLNPSTADAEQDDPTIRRCMGFARAWGYGGIEIVNLFALRSTSPAALYANLQPVGPKNDEHLAHVASISSVVICAWGAHGAHLQRGAAVRELLRHRRMLWHLGFTKDGEPKHPLYLKGDLRPMPWEEVARVS